MSKPLEISDAIWRMGEKTGFERFTSAEAWDWYIRGCPPGEAIDHGPGLLLRFLHDKKNDPAEGLKGRADQ